MYAGGLCNKVSSYPLNMYIFVFTLRFNAFPANYNHLARIFILAKHLILCHDANRRDNNNIIQFPYNY